MGLRLCYLIFGYKKRKIFLDQFSYRLCFYLLKKRGNAAHFYERILGVSSAMFFLVQNRGKCLMKKGGNAAHFYERILGVSSAVLPHSKQGEKADHFSGGARQEQGKRCLFFQRNTSGSLTMFFFVKNRGKCCPFSQRIFQALGLLFLALKRRKCCPFFWRNFWEFFDYVTFAKIERNAAHFYERILGVSSAMFFLIQNGEMLPIFLEAFVGFFELCVESMRKCCPFF